MTRVTRDPIQRSKGQTFAGEDTFGTAQLVRCGPLRRLAHVHGTNFHHRFVAFTCCYFQTST